jgi:hypothetical protein
MFTDKEKSTKFVVDLGPIQLPSGLATELEGEFQRLALTTLAKVDFRGDIRVGRLPWGVYGYIFDDWPPTFPPGIFDSRRPEPTDKPGGEATTLTARDHTLIMQIVMDRPLRIMRHLPSPKREQRPTGRQVLEAALKLDDLPRRERHSFELALATLGQLQSAGELPRPSQSALAKINDRIDRSTDLADVISTLESLERSSEFRRIDGIEVGLRVAREIAEDGRASIYSPNRFYEEYGDTQIMRSIVKEDVKGAVGGAVGTAVLGGAVVAGAVAGAAAGSVAEVAGAIWDMFTDLF